jgi:dihydroorotate dehydrogenase
MKSIIKQLLRESLGDEHITVKNKGGGFYEIYKGDTFLGRIEYNPEVKMFIASDENYEAFANGNFNDMVDSFGKRKKTKKYYIFLNGNMLSTKSFSSKKDAIKYMQTISKFPQSLIDKVEFRLF